MKIRSMLTAACACLIASGSILSFTTALPAQAAFDLGDFDGNDSIDVDDAVSVLTFYAKKAAGVAVDDLSDEQLMQQILIQMVLLRCKMPSIS